MSRRQHSPGKSPPGRGRLLILTGPSGVGKSPLRRALRREFPDLTAGLAPVLLHTSRPPRPDEREGEQYIFRRRAEIEELRTGRSLVVREVHGDLQAIDIEAVLRRTAEGDALFEGNVRFARLLLTHPRLRDVRRLGVFLSPLSRNAILLLRQKAGSSLPELVAELMRAKLQARLRRWYGREPTAEELADIQRRSEGAYRDLKEAHRFDYVLPNRDGEESDNWTAFEHPVGDARDALLCMATLLRGEVPGGMETWTPGVLP